MPLALVALAIGAFCIGTTEFVTAGILPEIASSLNVSIPVAGYLTSWYALGVTLGAPIITILTMHMRRKMVLLVLMLLFIAGSLLSALAPAYSSLMLGRIVSSLCHGAFFGIGAVVASNLVEKDKRASAIAFMFTGLTLANVIGVPLGTALGQHFGWRMVFYAITILGIIGFFGVLFLVPNLQIGVKANLRHELLVFKRISVWIALLVTAFGFSGVFASFTYIAPLLLNISGFSAASLSWLLILFGVGLVIGNTFGGKIADRALVRSLYGSLILLALILFIFIITAHYKIATIITLFLFGLFGFMTVAPLQIQAMRFAHESPNLASAANISAFNLGNAMGVFLGGLAIDQGFGYVSPNWVGGSLTIIGLLLAIVNERLFRGKEAVVKVMK